MRWGTTRTLKKCKWGENKCLLTKWQLRRSKKLCCAVLHKNVISLLLVTWQRFSLLPTSCQFSYSTLPVQDMYDYVFSENGLVAFKDGKLIKKEVSNRKLRPYYPTFIISMFFAIDPFLFASIALQGADIFMIVMFTLFQSITKWMGEEKMKKFNNFCLRYLADLEIPKKRWAEMLLVISIPQVCAHTHAHKHTHTHRVHICCGWWIQQHFI